MTRKPLGAQVDRLELASGRTEAWLQLGPSDAAGVATIGDVYLSNDGRSYAYSYSRILSVLYLVEGLE